MISLPFWASLLVWGFGAAVVVSVLMAGARGLGLTRMSLTFMLGTLFTANRERAEWIGLASHVALSWFFALLYALGFAAFGRADLWVGMFIGFVHGLTVLTVLIPLLPAIHPRMSSEYDAPEPTRMLEPPGFLALNYGRNTPLVTVVAHLAFGALLGGFFPAQPP